MRDIPLFKELKTLILRTDLEIVAIHLQGDQILQNRDIKSVLYTKYLRFLTLEELSQFGLEKGTINPWSVGPASRHIVDSHVPDGGELYTNDGTLYGSLVFPAEALKSLPAVTFAHFARDQ